MAKTPSLTTTDGREHWKHNTQAVQRAVARLVVSLPELAEWAKDVERGYSATSPGFGEGGGKGKSDPTAVLATTGKDYVRHVDGLARRVDAAFSELLALDGLVARLMPEEPVRGRESTITRCANCGEDCLPRAKAGRCATCYEYWRSHGRDPERPEKLTKRCRKRKNEAQRSKGHRANAH